MKKIEQDESLKGDEREGREGVFECIPQLQPNERGHEVHKQATPERQVSLLKTPPSSEETRPSIDTKFKGWSSPLSTAPSVWGSSNQNVGWSKSPKHTDFVSLGPLSSDFVGMSPLTRNVSSTENWRVVGSPTAKMHNFMPSNDDVSELKSTLPRQRSSSVMDTANSSSSASSNLDLKVEENLEKTKEPHRWGALGLKWTGMALSWNNGNGQKSMEYASLNDPENKDELIPPKFGRNRSQSQTMNAAPATEVPTVEIDHAIWPKVGDFNPLSAVVSSSSSYRDEIMDSSHSAASRRHSMIDSPEALENEFDLMKLESHADKHYDSRVFSSSDSNYKHVSFQWSSYKGVLYLIEFKAGRIEVYFVPETGGKPQLSVKIGDIVIVEADRGEDLGKIMGEITVERLKQLITPEDLAQDDRSDDDNPYGSLSVKEIVPKRIHRLAQSTDLRLMQAKAQEEAIAMVRCQSRVRQKKLPMEVVDAEYQWDRNKLTFYFVADRRIDFRELVRDLFRIYKTRIWMCAVDKNRSLYAKLKS